MLLIALKFESGDASIGWTLELLSCNVGAVVVDKECSVKMLNCSAFLNPVPNALSHGLHKLDILIIALISTRFCARKVAQLVHSAPHQMPVISD